MRNILLFAAVFCGLTSFAATTEVATFSSLEDGTKVGDYTVNGNCISGGTAWTYSEYITVIVKYSGLPASGEQAIVTLHQNSNSDQVGIIANNSKVHGLWTGGAYGSDGSSLDASGTIVFVYAPNQGANTGTKVYNAEGDSILDVPGLRASSGSVGDAINFGAKHDGSMKLDGFKVEALQILKGAAAANEVADLVATFEEAIKPAAPAVEPVLLINLHNNTQVEGWINYTQSTGSTIPSGSATIANGDVSFSTTAAGNFFPANWSQVNTDLSSEVVSEIKSSLGLGDIAFNANVYRTGLMNGGQTGNTATISGLTNGQKYIVYVGMGLKKNDDNNQVHGFKIASSGYTSVESREYLVTVAGQNTTVSTDYQSFNENTTIRPGVEGLMIVRLQDVVPNAEGKIAFTLDGVRSGFNFLAVAKVNETVEYTTAEIEVNENTSISQINVQITETNNKAEVTVAPGVTIDYDAALKVPTKLISTGSITLSAASKPDLTKLDLSGVEGGIVRTWLNDDEQKGIGFNFASARGPVVASALVADTKWYSDNDSNNGSNIAMSDDGLTTITWTSANTYDDDASTHGANSSASMVRGYLDDANGVSITVKNIPFAEYAVVIYASTDDPNNPKLTHKVVNDANYTYDSERTDVAKVGTDAWGQGRSSSAVAYGTNAIRVIEQTKGTLTIASPKNTSIKARGCISAIQIVPYSTFVNPTVTIASVETKCSEDYASNTITGTIADYVANSWEGDLTARVVVNSTVYESAAIKDNAFTIKVSGLVRETVYRTVLEVGYMDGETFKAIATKAIALYQGEQKFVWIASPFVIQEKTLVNDAQGLTIPNPFESPDYIDLCDSEYTVSISASEAVEADLDVALDGTEQGGVRIAQTSSGLKLQVVVDGAWTDFANAAVDATYTLKVKFHYEKSQEGETDATSVTYTLDSTTKTSTNPTGRLKVTEIFVSDGTNLADDLWGACQLDSAVVVDIELKPGEGDAIDYNTEEEANAAIKTLKIGICDAVKNVLTTAEEQENYRKYFHLVVVPSKMLENGFSVMPEFTTEATNEIEKELEKAMERVVEAFNAFDGKAEITGKPGLYYGVKRGDSLDSLSVKDDLQMAGADGKVTISITKPDTSKAHFYRIIVQPTK